MKLKGILDFSLGNFLCLRGFAPMGVLQDISAPPADFQRVPGDERLKEIGDYLRKGELVFFPEVILCTSLTDSDVTSELALRFFESLKRGEPFRGKAFSNGLSISSSVSRSKGDGDSRSIKYLQTATLSFTDQLATAFSRIDGNHRLAATEAQAVRERVTPYCLILCQNEADFRRFSRSLFHNINYKQVPLTMEHNLRLILDDKELFPDELLQDDPTFGWPYYLARQLFGKGKLDFELLPNLKNLANSEPGCFLVEQFEYLIRKKVLGENENATVRFKKALSEVNSLFDLYPLLKDAKNRGLLGTLTFYRLSNPACLDSFVRWVLNNNLHLIENSSVPDLISIFDKVLETRKRTIFVSMPFGKEITENHYTTIRRISKEIGDEYSLKPPLKVERVDWFHDGTSYSISDKIIEMMSDCGLLIADLTYCNPNVYHEIGFMTGKAKAEGTEPNMLLFLDESVPDPDDKYVGFNIGGIKQIRFTQSEQFGPLLAKNLEKFFRLKD